MQHVNENEDNQGLTENFTVYSNSIIHAFFPEKMKKFMLHVYIKYFTYHVKVASILLN